MITKDQEDKDKTREVLLTHAFEFINEIYQSYNEAQWEDEGEDE